MGSAERRKRETALTRQRILDAARDLFVRKGYDATSMRAIAERIEYTPTAIYHHFASKEALVHELCIQDFRSLGASFLRIGRVADPVERLDRIGEAYVEFGMTYPMHYQLMFMAMRPQVTPELGVTHTDPSEDAYGFLLGTVQEAIEQGRMRPEYADADEVAQILWGALHGLIALHIAKSHEGWVPFRDVRETARAARKALLAGLTKTGA